MMSRCAVALTLALAAGGTSRAAESVVRFEPAPGRDGRARFVARGSGHAVLLDRDGPALLLRGAAVGLDRLSSTSNHLIGRDPRRWRLGVPHYGRVEYRGVYPGIDLAVHGDGGRLEYARQEAAAFVVAGFGLSLYVP